MSTISLKNHLNFADNTRTNKINANTTLCPLISQQALTPQDIKLVEINFKAADKINVIFQIQPETTQDISALFQATLLSYNEAVRDKTFTTTYASLLTNELILNEQIDVTQPTLDALFYVKFNKGGIKSDKYEAEIQFKKVIQFESAPKTPQPTTATKPTQTTTTTAINKPIPAKQNQHQQHAQMISNHVLTTLFDRKQPLDFAILQQVYTLNQKLNTLTSQLAIAKNKEKATLETKINEINAELASIQPQYDFLQQQITSAVTQDVVTVSNVGYSKGLSAVKK
jgi:hypothetical protein